MGRFGSSSRVRGPVALAVGAAALLAACTGTPSTPEPTGPTTSAEPSPEPVTITWWIGASAAGPDGDLWEDVAREFEDAHAHVTVEVRGYRGSEPSTEITAGDSDVFLTSGANELAAQIDGDLVRDITDDVAEEIETVGGTISPWTFEGRTYALPYSFGIEGFWYNTDLFEQAGIEGIPATVDELYDAIEKLKAAGTTPIALGAGDGWPAAHYWYNFALKACSPTVLESAQANLEFADPCFVEAGEMLKELIDSEPFNEGYLTTSSQQSTTSAAGLVATGQAAMELMGHWEPGVMAGILRDTTGDEGATPPEFLGWFNFPAIEGTDGEPTAVLGGGGAFAVSAGAPDEAVDLLRYVLSEDVQRRFGASGAGLPVVPAAQDSITDPHLQMVLEGLNSATYVQLWLDTAYGPVVGGALNEAIVNLFVGAGTPEDVVDVMAAAVETL